MTIESQLAPLAARHDFASVPELVAALASGEVATVLLSDEARAWAAAWLAEQAQCQPDPLHGQALADLATALRAAIDLEYEVTETERYTTAEVADLLRQRGYDRSEPQIRRLARDHGLGILHQGRARDYTEADIARLARLVAEARPGPARKVR